MPGRRSEDRAPEVLHLSLTEPSIAGALSPLISKLGPAGEEEAAILCTTPTGTLSIEGFVRLIPASASSAAPEEGSGDANPRWLRRAAHLRRRMEAGERFVVFAEQISRARTRHEVLEALSEHAPAIVGGFLSLVWLDVRRGHDPEDSADPPSPVVVRASSAVPALSSPALVTRLDAQSSEAFRDLADVYEKTRSAAGAIVPVNDGIALIVLERRCDRTWEPGDWFLLRSMAGLTRAILERYEAREPKDMDEGLTD